MVCFKCHKETGFKDMIGRRDSCPHCHVDARVCKNCAHYDARAYNECREPAAERVVEKERSNFCDQFTPNLNGEGAGAKKGVDQKSLAEALFKKKG